MTSLVAPSSTANPSGISPSWQAACERLTVVGLNVFGVADPADYDAAVVPERRVSRVCGGAGSIVVVANGGPALWSALLAAIQRDPTELVDHAHPLDDFVRKGVEQADSLLPASITRRWFFAAADAEPLLDFRALAQLAGIGQRSRLGLLIHETYGLWLGLRAACFTEDSLAPFPMARSPCDHCASPCMGACPGGALVSGSWDVDRCTAFHVESDACSATCHSRMACPVGAEHRYPSDELEYHYNRALGRRHLRVAAGARPDRYQGEGPHWHTWRERPSAKS